jgi:two-component system, chemotaxis family, chemotaxis protein CheY
MTFSILIVDDDWVMRTLIARTLRMSGVPLANVYEACDGRAGAAAARDHHIDIVITDLNMPVMNGDAMIEQLRGDPRTAALPIIVVSSDASLARRDRLSASKILFVQKPFTREQIRDVVLQTLGLPLTGGPSERATRLDDEAV